MQKRWLTATAVVLVTGCTTVALAVTSAEAPAAEQPHVAHLDAGSEVLATEQAGTTGLSTLQLRDIGGHLVITLDKKHDTQRRPAVSPADGTVAVSVALDQEGGRYGLATVSTSGVVYILTKPRYADIDPAWRADGQRIAAVRMNGYFDSNHCCQLITVGADGVVSRVPGATGIVRDPAWSPDGQTLTYAGAQGLWTVPATGGKPNLIASGNGFSDPEYSPDGKRIVFVQRLKPGTQRLIMINVNDHQKHLLGRWPNAVESPQWDADGLGMLVLTFTGDGDIGRSHVRLMHVDILGRKRLVANMPARTHGLGRGFITPPPPPPPVCTTPVFVDSPSPTVTATPSPSPSVRRGTPTVTPSPSPSPTDTPSPSPSASVTPCPTSTPSDSASPSASSTPS